MLDTKLAKAGAFPGFLFRSLPCIDALPEEHGWLLKLLQHQDRQLGEHRLLQDLIVQANDGVALSDILDRLYDSLRSFIPFDRIGLALLESNGAVLRARWGRSESPLICLKPGYSAPLAGSSLQRIVQTGLPRILNDQGDHLRAYPGSASTALMLEE